MAGNRPRLGAESNAREERAAAERRLLAA
jgi:hypothetical protein